MIVRRLTDSDDLTEATALLVSFFAQEQFGIAAAAIPAKVRAMAGLDVCGLFVAEEDGTAIGVATVSLDFGIEYGWSAELGDLYVLPQWRGRHVADALIEAVEAFLASRGVAAYQVTVLEQAQAAHDLFGYYRRRGFADEGRRLLHKTLPGSAP